MVNITMLCANRPRLLKQALDSIGDLSDATVTIRDAGINRDVANVTNEWAINKPCAYKSDSSPVGTGPARNDVIHCSEFWFERGEYLYLSDDDVFHLRTDWLKIITTTYDQAWEHGFRVLGAYGHPFHRPIAPTTYLGGRWIVNEVYACATQSLLMSWDVWDKYGPFCDTPPGKVCQSEDADFCNKIRADGLKIGVISPPLLVNCGITNSFGDKIPGWEMVKAEAPAGVIVE